MVPRVAKQGRSFKGAALYYLHDKDALTTERVRFTDTVNTRTNDPDKAWKEMAYTALHQQELKQMAGVDTRGRKLEFPVYAYSLAWGTDETPDQAEMSRAALDSLQTLKLDGHEAVLVAHQDTEHPHIHVIVNRVHPETGIAANVYKDHKTLSRWAEAYERDQGKIRCEQRVENNKKREKKQRVENNKKREKGTFVKHRDPVIQSAWERSDNGKSFGQALYEQGYRLAQGDKLLAQGNRLIVIVDREGKVHNPRRQIEGVKKKDIDARFADLERVRLPSVKKARQWTTEQKKQARTMADKQARQDQEQARRDRDLKAAAEAKQKIEARKERKAKTQAQKAPDRAEHWDRDRYNADQEQQAMDAAIRQEKLRPVREKAQKAAEKARESMESRAGKAEQKAERQAESQNAMHLRQLDERRSFEQWADRRRQQTRQELEKTYHRREAEAALKAAEAQLAASQGLFSRLTGKTARAQEQVENLKLNLADIDRRETEVWDRMESGVAGREELMATRHQAERRRYDREPAPERTPANDDRLRQAWEVAKKIKQRQDKEQSRKRDRGPER